MIEVKEVLPEMPEHLAAFLQERIDHLVNNNTDEFEACMIVCDHYCGDKASVLKNMFISYFAWRKVNA